MSFNYRTDEDAMITKIAKLVGGILVCGIVAFNSFTIIETGERSVVLRLG